MGKNLAEALILIKLNYANALFYNISKYFQRQMQEIQDVTVIFAKPQKD